MEQINAYFWNNILEIGCIVCIDHGIFQKKFAMLFEMETKVFVNCYAMQTKSWFLTWSIIEFSLICLWMINKSLALYLNHSSHDETELKFIGGGICFSSCMKTWHMALVRLEKTFAMFWSTFWIFLFVYFKYWRCSLKVHLWTMFHLFSISMCVALTWSMASTIALQLLLVVSLIGEKTLFPFRLTLVFPSVVGVFPLLVETNAKIDYLANLQKAFVGMNVV